MFYKKGVLRNFGKFIGEHLCQSLFFIKKETLTLVFSSECYEISKNTFFTEQLWTTASEKKPEKKTRNRVPHDSGKSK